MYRDYKQCLQPFSQTARVRRKRDSVSHFPCTLNHCSAQQHLINWMIFWFHIQFSLICSLMLRLGSGSKISPFLAWSLRVSTNRSRQRLEARKETEKRLLLLVFPFLVWIVPAVARPPGDSNFLLIQSLPVSAEIPTVAWGHSFL